MFYKIILLGMVLAAAEAVSAGSPDNKAATQSPELPRKFGLSALYVDLNSERRVGAEVLMGLSPPLMGALQGQHFDVDLTAEMLALRGDWYALPFLNLNAFLGKVESEVQVGIDPILLAALFGQPSNIKIDQTQNVYGLGATASGAYNHFIASLAYVYTAPYGDTQGLEYSAISITPQIGYMIPHSKLRLLAGAHYFSLDGNVVRQVPTQFGLQDIGVKIGSSDWGKFLSMQMEIARNFEGTVSWSEFDEKRIVTLQVGMRFK